MSDENRPETITRPRSEIADALTSAVAGITDLKPEQILSITAGSEQILIGYRGPRPGLLGGGSRQGLMTYDTRTGKLLGDEAIR